MPPCPNCGTTIPPGARLCPNCGFELPTVWPPPPVGAPPPAARPLHVSGAQLTLGVVLGFFLVPILGIGALMTLGSLSFHSFVGRMLTSSAIVGGPALGLYYGTRRRFPAFARAFGWAALGMFAVTLGALAACYAFLAGWQHQIDTGR